MRERVIPDTGLLFKYHGYRSGRQKAFRKRVLVASIGDGYLITGTDQMRRHIGKRVLHGLVILVNMMIIKRYNCWQAGFSITLGNA